jgi:hypothetical protein
MPKWLDIALSVILSIGILFPLYAVFTYIPFVFRRRRYRKTFNQRTPISEKEFLEQFSGNKLVADLAICFRDELSKLGRVNPDLIYSTDRLRHELYELIAGPIGFPWGELLAAANKKLRASTTCADSDRMAQLEYENKQWTLRDAVEAVAEIVASRDEQVPHISNEGDSQFPR